MRYAHLLVLRLHFIQYFADLEQLDLCARVGLFAISPLFFSSCIDFESDDAISKTLLFLRSPLDLGPRKHFAGIKIKKISFFFKESLEMSGWIQMPDGHPGALGSATSEREQAQSLKDAAAKVHMHKQCACVLVILNFLFSTMSKYWRQTSFQHFPNKSSILLTKPFMQI